MPRNSVETETLARLYLGQGHPERAAAIFHQLLQEEPGRATALEGLERCREALAHRRAEEGMDQEKKLRILKRLLGRLLGEPMEEPALLPPVAVTYTPVAPQAEEPVVASRMIDPRERKLTILKSMLERLVGLARA